MTEAAEAGRGPGAHWASTWTPTQYADNGGVRIAYDQLADPAGGPGDTGDTGHDGHARDPLLLVMGLAVSRFWWPAGLARAFADQGFAVARYDQRDAGQSTRMPDAGARQSVRRARPQAGRLLLRGHDRRRGRGA